MRMTFELLNVRKPVDLVRLGFIVWLQWILATFGGFLISLLWIQVGERPDLGFISGLVGGSIIGIGQFLVLRQYLSFAYLWIGINALTWAFLSLVGVGVMGWIVPRGMENLTLRMFYGLLEGTTVGIFLGGTQWLFLRQQIPQAWRWIVTSIISWAVSLAMGWIAGAVFRGITGIFLGEVIGLAIAWFFLAILTGVAMVWLLEFFE